MKEVDKMTTLRDQEPEINIYTGDKKLDASKRSRSNQNTNGKPSKKQKVKPSANRKSSPRTEAITGEESSERNRSADASYRHLFTFAGEQDKNPQQGASTTPLFSFLKEDDEIANSEKEKATTEFRPPHREESRLDLNEIRLQNRRNDADDSMEIDRPSDAILPSEYPDRDRAGYEHTKGRRLTFQGSNRQWDENFEAVRRQAADSLTIPEDIEFRPDEILRLATRFCRQQSIEDLEEEWCAPGGTRETMKRDFKQKRQNITRVMTDTNDETGSYDIVQACDEFRKAAFDEHEDDLATCEYVFRCVSAMKAHPRDREIQNSATLALTALCEKRKLGQFIGECGGLEALLLSADMFIHDEGVVKNSLVLCRSLMAYAENRQRFRIHSGLKLLVHAMDLHPKRSAIQRISCFLISVLSCEQDVERYRFVENGVIPPVMSVLNRFDTAEERSLHLDACHTLANITRYPDICSQVVDADCYLKGMSRLIVASDDGELVYSALCVFRNILAHHETAKFPLGVGRRITRIMLRFLEESSQEPLRFRMCHEVCFSLLRSELLSEDHVIEPVFFLRLCMRYLQAYLQTTRIQEHAVVAHSCACIRLLLFAAHNRVVLRRIPESIETLIRAISFLSERPIRVEQALLALGNAVFDSKETQARADRANVLQIIAETMDKNHFNAAVTIAGLQAIHAVCASNHHTIEKAISLGAQTLCVKSMRSFKDNPHVQEAGLATVAALAQTDSGVHALRHSLALGVVRRAQEQFPFSQKIILLIESIEDLVDDKTALVQKQSVPPDEARKQSLASRLIRKLSSKPLTKE